MIYFPKISLPNYPLTNSFEDNSAKSQFEDGSMQSRLKFTRSREKFKVVWNHLPDNEWRILKHFIIHKAKFSANSFMWLDPSTVDSDYGRNDPHQRWIEVRLTAVDDVKLTGIDHWSVTLELTEV